MPDDGLQPNGEVVLQARHYAILTSASFQEVHEHVLRQGETFAVLDQHGDITRVGNGELGLYHEGTRYLSRLEFWLGDVRPVLLNSAVRRDNSLLTANLTNPDVIGVKGRNVAHGTLHVARSKLVCDGSFHEHIVIRNFGAETVTVPFSFVFDADFRDIFEVRGTERARRGERLPNENLPDGMVLSYKGLDDIVRRSMIRISSPPTSHDDGELSFEMTIPPGQQKDITLAVVCSEDAAATCRTHADAVRSRLARSRHLRAEACSITTSNAQFNNWIECSLEDVHMLLQRVPDGYYPYAGIPWYNTYFGRDGILTALMTLWVNPRIARGVLGYLAATQATDLDEERVAEPGKILHESRKGEMANLGEIPFGRYYGTVDATPLFIILAGVYFEHTGDRAFVRKIWPNVQRALAWIDEYGDLDGDGFVEYRSHSTGLTQQGWKDSEDSVFHADGRLAEGPIALCEVQGYVYAAFRRAAKLAAVFGSAEQAEQLEARAVELRSRFHEAFWCEDIETYALALDGNKEPCRVRTSNAGHTLFTGIADRSSADRLAQGLFAREMYSGWGIRTLSSREARYNPMSYHNGSVWPHDNALIGWGLARYGQVERTHQLLDGFFDASLFDPLQRLPELYCGFIRRRDEGPTPYPVACSPQAWASAAVFYLLQACCGLQVNAARKRVLLREPSLPKSLREMRIANLRVGDGKVDLVLQRYAQTVGVDVTGREGDVEVAVIT